MEDQLNYFENPTDVLTRMALAAYITHVSKNENDLLIKFV